MPDALCTLCLFGVMTDKDARSLAKGLSQVSVVKDATDKSEIHADQIENALLAGRHMFLLMVSNDILPLDVLNPVKSSGASCTWRKPSQDGCSEVISIFHGPTASHFHLPLHNGVPVIRLHEIMQEGAIQTHQQWADFASQPQGRFMVVSSNHQLMQAKARGIDDAHIAKARARLDHPDT